jgi:hypothetical protein
VGVSGGEVMTWDDYWMVRIWIPLGVLAVWYVAKWAFTHPKGGGR